MTPERWQKVKDIFDSALRLESDHRSVFLARACGNDVELLQEVESLISAHENTGTFIDSPAYEMAAELIVNDKVELKPGQTIGAFEITYFIGRGGMGEVYLAQDTKLGGKVSLKLLPPS